MFLLIDNSDREKINLAWFDENELEHKTYPGRNTSLLLCIDKFLKTHKVAPEAIQGVVVVVGAGGFTSTRVAVVAANTFGYILQIPLLAITEDKIKKVQELIPILKKQTPGQYLSATYSAPPNITKPKNK